MTEEDKNENEPETDRKEPSVPPAVTPSGRPRPRPLYYNVISHIGTLTVIATSVLILFAIVAHLTFDHVNPYVGIITFLVFPGILVFGLLLVLLGMRWEAGRRKRVHSLNELPYPRVDLNDPRHRRLFGISVVGGVLIAALIATVSYQGFHFTESVTFCGQTCHVPMKPEFTAYKNSSHARVPCTDCHVGEGADWYVRSKLSGVRQVFAVTFNTYQRPIPTPIEHLRPARETCERCHWPEKFFGAKLLQLPHYRYDEQNSAEQISLMLKVGGGSKAHGESQGIHWHMVVANTITYSALDKKRQVIPWVKVKRADGTETTFISRKSGVAPAELAGLERHTMDCMDCHNRPAHKYPTPDSGVDEALMKGRISRDLPWIKKTAVEALFKDYADEASAHEGIRKHIESFYRNEYAAVYQRLKPEIDRAVQVARKIYDNGVFPQMNVNWQTYPMNIGHRYWAGCFRCHDGEHVSDDGRVIASDCNSTCHSQPERGTLSRLGHVPSDAQEDWHPWRMPKEHLDVKGHDTVQCHQCHDAGRRPSKDCDDCHEK